MYLSWTIELDQLYKLHLKDLMQTLSVECFFFLFLSIFNLASGQQNLEGSSSSEDENENLTLNDKVCASQ